jgi:AhpD family alkylhydroperoxidase
VPNLYAVVGTLSPESLKTVLDAEGVLAASTLSKQDAETVKLLVSALTGCDYCVAAHSLLGKMAGLSPDVLRQIRAGEPTGDAKRDALVTFVRTIVQTSGTLSREAFDAIRAAGYSDAQLVDISLAVALTIFTNAFNRINDTDIDFPPVK